MNIFVDETTEKKQVVQQQEDLIANHSWYGKTAHIMRAGGLVTRCEILEIVLRPCFVGLRVRYRKDGVSKRRQVSPIFLMAMHMLWWSHQVVSDDEASTTIGPTETTLPLLRLLRSEESRLTHDQKMALTWTLEQTDLIHELL